MASADYSVLTPERVSVEYDIAGIGSRGAAAIVDTSLQGLALFVFILALSGLLSAVSALGGPSGDIVGGLFIGLMALGVFLVTSGYFMLFEIVWSGQTPGKRLLGLRVMRENGYPMRPVDAVIRNLVRIVDWLPFFYGIGVLVMLLNGRSKRLGDFASGTLVVREGSQRTLTFAVPPLSAQPSLPDQPTPPPVRLSSADATLVRDYLVRRASMHPTARHTLAIRLAAALAQRYHLPRDNEDADPEQFLERLAG